MGGGSLGYCRVTGSVMHAVIIWETPREGVLGKRGFLKNIARPPSHFLYPHSAQGQSFVPESPLALPLMSLTFDSVLLLFASVDQD